MLVTERDIKDAEEAGNLLGVDLHWAYPTSIKYGKDTEEVRYGDLKISKKNIGVYFFKNLKGEDTIKVYLEE
jgi:hypothetical protein